MRRWFAAFSIVAIVGVAGAEPRADDRTMCNSKEFEAIDACTRLLDRNPRDEAALQRRASLNEKMSYDDEAAGLALKDRSALIALNPRDPQRYADRAKLYRDASDYVLAIADANKALELDARNAARYAGRADIYQDSGDFDRAIADLNQAVKLDSKKPDYYASRALIYKESGDFDRAVPDLTTAVKLDGKNAARYAERAKLYEAAGDFARADADYSDAIRLQPDSGFYRLGQAEMHLNKLHDLDRVVADCDEALAVADKIAKAMKLDEKLVREFALEMRGDAHMEMGDSGHAIVDYGRIIANSPSRSLYTKLGNAHLEAGDLDHALSDFNEALKSGSHAAALTGRGSVYKAQGDADRAFADYAEAAKLNDTNAMKLRADMLVEKGRLEEALADYGKAIELSRNFVAAYVARGLLYERMGQKAKALDDFRIALAVPAENRLNRQAHEAAQARLAVLDPPSAPGGAAQVAATPGRRVALVIGNGAYAAMPRLRNPTNDATDVAAALKILGFEVTLGTDVKRNDMEDDLIRFAREARQSEVALVYFAGHGLQHNGINYLVPVDSRIEEEGDLRRLIEVQSVIEDLRVAHGARILILDACRDNGVAQQVASLLPADRSAAFDRGLGRIDRDTARGTVVVFATQPNRVAKDGSGHNSPFTEALLRQLPSPGIELRTLMTRVRDDVVRNTGGDQWPEVSDSMVGEFVFKAGP